MAIRNLMTNPEYDDDLGYDDLVNIVGGEAAPAAQPAFNPVGFDWSKGVQNIGGTVYAPRFDFEYLRDDAGNIVYDEAGQPARLMQGEGEAAQYVQGPAKQYIKYKEAEKKPGGFYEVYDASGKLLGYEPFVEEDFGRGGFFEDIFGQAKDIAVETAPLWTMAVGAGPLGSTLGSAAASGLGITGLSAAQTAALGSAIAGGANTALQGGDLGDVLKGAVTTALPSFVLPNIPSTGTPALDKAIQAGAQAAIRGGDVKSVVVGSLLNSGLGAAVGKTGLDSKLVDAVVQLAQSGGDPQKLLNAFVTGASSLSRPTAGQAASAGYGGADIGDFFDSEREGTPGEYYRGLDNVISEWDEADVIPTTYDTTPKTSMTPVEMSQFLEANIDDPGTIETLMQDYFPELYTQRIETTAKKEDAGTAPRSIRDVGTVTRVQPGEKLDGTTVVEPDLSKNLPTVQVDKKTTPGKKETQPSKKGPGIDALLAALAAMNQRPEKEEDYRVANIQPLGYDLMYGLRG